MDRVFKALERATKVAEPIALQMFYDEKDPSKSKSQDLMKHTTPEPSAIIPDSSIPALEELLIDEEDNAIPALEELMIRDESDYSSYAVVESTYEALRDAVDDPSLSNVSGYLSSLSIASKSQK